MICEVNNDVNCSRSLTPAPLLEARLWGSESNSNLNINDVSGSFFVDQDVKHAELYSPLN